MRGRLRPERARRTTRVEIRAHMREDGFDGPLGDAVERVHFGGRLRLGDARGSQLVAELARCELARAVGVQRAEGGDGAVGGRGQAVEGGHELPNAFRGIFSAHQREGELEAAMVVDQHEQVFEVPLSRR